MSSDVCVTKRTVMKMITLMTSNNSVNGGDNDEDVIDGNNRW